DDLLEILRREIEQVAQAAGHALEVPDVGDGSGQLHVPHALTAHGGLGDLHAAALADDALEAHALVLAAVALPVPGGAEDALAEQAVHLGLQGAVVDGLRLLDLAVGPAADVIGGREADAQLVEGVDVDHRCPSLDRKSWCLRERGSRAGPGGGWAARRSRGLLPVPRPSDLFDGADALVVPAGQVDAELLRG